MLNKLADFICEQKLIAPGDSVICAVSGGADSVALLFALYLLKEKLHFQLSAAHFNHHLRGEESDGDERFVRNFCDRYDIPLFVGGCQVIAGKKGLEASAREARYAFLNALPGKVATAHTADDNAETVLMHLLRGSGLKGLGGIMPVNGKVIRPMLSVTREDVVAFLEEYYLSHAEDSSNNSERFLRNRIRHEVVPRLRQENPSFSGNVSAMALRLRQDEDFISGCMQPEMPGVLALRRLHPALRIRYLERFLKQSGVPEPEVSHLQTAEKLVFSEKPSARADFPGGVVISRQYDRLAVISGREEPIPCTLKNPGTTVLPEWGITVTCEPAEQVIHEKDRFTVVPQGEIRLRTREPGDVIRLAGGTRSLKKLFIDRKIPASERGFIPVLADEAGVLAVGGIGINEDRKAIELPAVMIRIEKTEN